MTSVPVHVAVPKARGLGAPWAGSDAQVSRAGSYSAPSPRLTLVTGVTPPQTRTRSPIEVQAQKIRLLGAPVFVMGVQVSAAHERRHLERAVEAFTQVGHDLGVLKGATR